MKRNRTTLHRIWLVAALLFAMWGGGGCAGWKVGNADLYPTEVETVYVPMFESNSFRRNIGERITEAVVKEITNKTHYRVVSSPDNADSILTGQIQESKSVLVSALSGDARESQTALCVKVTWTNRRSGMIRASNEVPLPVEVTGTGNVVPEVGQSLATAQQDAICKLARQIVGLMEKPW